MNLGKKIPVVAVVTIASLSLLGLSWVQFGWIKESIKMNEKIFHQRIDVATNKVGEEIKKDDVLLKSIIRDLRSSNTLSEPSNRKISDIIVLILTADNIFTDFEFGLYQHDSGSSSDFIWLGGTSDSELAPTFVCPSEDRPFGWTDVTCSLSNPDYGNYHLGLFFPQKDFYLLSQIKSSLLTSCIFIVLFTLCFGYTILTIRRQKKLSEIKNDFVDNLTHEFKTPIFSIGVASKILKKAPELQSNNKLQECVEVIRTETTRLKNQVDKVLQVALIDSGNFQLEKQTLSMHILIKEIARCFEILANKQGGKVILTLRAEEDKVAVDETHLKNVLFNLLENSLKNTTETPRIEISTKNADGCLEVSAQDNGVGMDKDVQNHVFEKFYRNNSGETCNNKGFGLGLSYVKSVVDAHGGEIFLVSSKQSGTTFKIRLPQ